MILSVPHTGTQFLGGLVGGGRAHVFLEDLGAYMDGQVYTPLRDPLEVYLSWHRRYPAGRFPISHSETISLDDCWKRLVEWDAQLDIFYMPIDVDREFHLQRLSEHLGREVQTDWAKVGSYEDDSYVFVDREALSWVYELPMIKRFYG